MDLVVFDLDGTLLNKQSQISPYTRETLALLRQQGIAYTVATGRTLHATQAVLADDEFIHPHIYKNGVVIWQPQHQHYSHSVLLTSAEIEHVIEAFLARNVTPFLFSLEPGQHHGVYHPPLQNEVEHKLKATIIAERSLPVHPVEQMPNDAQLTNISALGPFNVLEAITELVATEEQLVAYMGSAFEDGNLGWIDIHHSDGSKGSAVSILKQELGASRVICFGDADNDLSMFAVADECYAPANARETVKLAATAVIDDHDEDGIARFLRQRFNLSD